MSTIRPVVLATLIITAAAGARADDAAVRREIEADYARSVQALKSQDGRIVAQVLQQITTPDFAINGAPARQALLALLQLAGRQATPEPVSPFREVSYTLRKLTIQRDQATALMENRYKLFLLETGRRKDAERISARITAIGTAHEKESAPPAAALPLR